MPAEGDILLRRVFPVPADAIDQAGQVSTEVRRLLRGLGVEPEVVRRAGIVCFEGEMNIALYTKGGRIVLVVRPDRVELLFSDRGPGWASPTWSRTQTPW